MTFSLIGHCARTGQFGCAVTTSAMGVGARVPFAEAGLGAVLTQHRTDPRLGPRGLDLLRSGCSAEEALAALVASTPHHRWRQIAIMDRAGRTAHFDGEAVKHARAAVHAPGCVALGNIMANTGVPAAMATAFAADPGEPLAERLMRALEAGEEAGGEGRPLLSACLLVVHEQRFPYVDLRVDLADAALPALRLMWNRYRPDMDEHVVRAVDPEAAKPPVL
ncbi:DUF1028 domain-containing protein [Roseococcus suduntuyensis]|uniref:Putative Ntn-hydrolase superfamily protein n=1 Tax=Roseococcus suduntuyensis TaxID=455361 RepID=A0A840A9R1_9PROT|nr:DUF1028 domain-containing protein [Roseococcus suduntuyensis]MBB3898239.1 putative Ntn-hydrolase superfamily protein [Roseococcus suduntuyensis]